MSLTASLSGRRGAGVKNCNIAVYVCLWYVCRWYGYNWTDNGDKIMIQSVLWHDMIVCVVWYLDTVCVVWYHDTVCVLWYHDTVCVVWYHDTVCVMRYHDTVCVVSVQNVSLPIRKNSVTGFYIFEIWGPRGGHYDGVTPCIPSRFCLQNMEAVAHTETSVNFCS